MTSQLSIDRAAILKDVSVAAVARYFGGSCYSLTARTRERIIHGIAEAAEFVVPRASFQLLPVSGAIAGNVAQLENGMALPLPGCCPDAKINSVAAVIATLGDGLEGYCRRLAEKGEIYASTLLDAVGTVMLDLLGDRVHAVVAGTCAGQGLAVGRRFAPGINGYPLEYQHLLFKLVDHGAIGVALNSSAIMVPAKSISFFLPITAGADDAKAPHKCFDCAMPQCQFRSNPAAVDDHEKLN
jgi:hypothetical protein